MTINNPFDFFDYIYCINLPKSTQRWEKSLNEFKKLGIEKRVEKIYADPPPINYKSNNFQYPPGEFGVCLSQQKALVHAISNNFNNVLIFEDDVGFNENTLEILAEALNDLPDNWDLFYLGGNPRENLTLVGKNLSKTGFFYGAFAYAINKKAMLNIYDKQINNISKNFPKSAYDYTLAEYASENNGYCVDRYICYNVPGESVIRNSHRNYNSITEKLWNEFSGHNNKRSNLSLDEALKM